MSLLEVQAIQKYYYQITMEKNIFHATEVLLSPFTDQKPSKEEVR